MTIAVPDLLTSLVLELRHELHAEVPVKLHDSAGMRGKSTKGGAAGDMGGIEQGTVLPKQRAVGWTGLPFSVRFERRLSHRDWWGLGELGLSSIGEVGDWCRSRHASDLHRSPGRSTSLCERIVSGLAEFGQPLEHVAWREGIDPELAYALAVQALRHGASWRHRELHRYMRTARERERDSRVDCPACRGRVVVMRPRRNAA